MIVEEIYKLAVKLGVANDLRGQATVEKNLKRLKQKFERLDEEKQDVFDKERLVNPYSDTRILYESKKKKQIKKILIGIDIEGDELLLADKLGVDLVIGHHPRGKALANLSDVMHLQAEVLALYGVPINIAESLLKIRISEVARGTAPINHNRPVDMARLLDLNFMCLHTVCDNLVANFLKKIIDKEKNKIEYVEDVINILKSIPEYQEAQKIGVGPRLFAGSEENRAGKIALTEITGGTEGSPKIYEKMAQAGIGTIIGMHMSEEHKKEAENAHINALIAGHISSDSIGINLFLDQLAQKGIEIIPCSGLIRVSRLKKK
ncbi:MAG: NGG1p interacting factor NIF3 [Candidatus Buchananbacteria bacterium RBG_13_36_9]|uniref:NGG1p interacting factor NIF3 n=1 Tax=Candidatus Buchananbacteria bacterium RBG_13_36_9 TaxID=1797530 RepID=A0A1G1XPU8_9BACT|nr:MAG: NGG1p interacting factor NIF3 [Candidatus Buchananbacteria bacterium RBG_13_36_9]